MRRYASHARWGVRSPSIEDSKAGTRELLFYELTWSPISEPEKTTLIYDSSGEYEYPLAPSYPCYFIHRYIDILQNLRSSLLEKSV